MKVGNLKGNVIMLESQVYTGGTVYEKLDVMVDNQEQYFWQPCMAVPGMVAPDTDAEHDEDFRKA